MIIICKAKLFRCIVALPDKHSSVLHTALETKEANSSTKSLITKMNLNTKQNTRDIKSPPAFGRQPFWNSSKIFNLMCIWHTIKLVHNVPPYQQTWTSSFLTVVWIHPVQCPYTADCSKDMDWQQQILTDPQIIAWLPESFMMVSWTAVLINRQTATERHYWKQYHFHLGTRITGQG